MKGSRVCVYIASSLDGFIAGPDDDLSWLTEAEPEAAASFGEDDSVDGALSYEEFMAGIGALLMGRRTYDALLGFGVPWPYGERPVLVATSRPLDADPVKTVRRVEGSIDELIELAQEAATGGDVYLDGGTLIRQAAEADLIDDLTITIAPIAIGAGSPLFAGLTNRYPLEIVSHHSFPGGMVQVRVRPRRVRARG